MSLFILRRTFVLRGCGAVALLALVSPSTLRTSELLSPIRTATIPVELGAVSHGRWANGIFVQFKQSYIPGRPSAIWAYDREGKEVIRRTTDVSIPSAYHTLVHSATADPRGNLIVSVETWDQGGLTASALCVIAPPGELEYVVRTDSFVAQSLAIAPSGDIWGFGTKRIGFQRMKGDYHTVERYDARGRLVSQLLPRSSFGTPYHPASDDDIGGPARVVTSSSRVGVYSGVARYWAEFTTGGEFLHGFKVEIPAVAGLKSPVRLLDLQMTEGNRVYAMLVSRHPPGSVDLPFYKAYYQLDRANRRWVLVADWLPEHRLGGNFGGIFGAGGESLSLRYKCCEFGWFVPPSPVKDE